MSKYLSTVLFLFFPSIQAKASGKKLQKVTLKVSPRGIILYDSASNQLIENISIYRSVVLLTFWEVSTSASSLSQSHFDNVTFRILYSPHTISIEKVAVPTLLLFSRWMWVYSPTEAIMAIDFLSWKECVFKVVKCFPGCVFMSDGCLRSPLSGGERTELRQMLDWAESDCWTSLKA